MSSAGTPLPLELVSRIGQLELRVRELERQTPDAVSIQDDDGAERVRLGLQDDGSYGIRIWDAGGTLRHDQTF
jgi:hypothetical protein